MVLSKKSWHYWIYHQFFQWPANNFCPYFWKTLLCALIIIPCTIICIPFWVLNGIFGKEEPQRIGEDFGAGLATVLIGGFVICMISMFFSHNKAVDGIGLVGWCITGFITLIGVIAYLSDKVSLKNSFVGTFIEAKKNKHCPKIEWEEELKTV